MSVSRMPLLKTGLSLHSQLAAFSVFSVLVLHHSAVFLLLTHSCAGQSQLIGPPQPILSILGDDIILPCHLEPAVDVAATTVEWMRPDLNPRFVHVWRGRQDFLTDQNPSYEGRTSLFTDKLKDGDVSLKLSKVKLTDEGIYRCFIPTLEQHSFVELVVGAASSPVIIVSKSSSGVVLECESKGWYPEPELFWLDAEGKLLSAGAPETLRGPDGLYTVSSRVTVEKSHSNSFTCRVQQKKIQQTRQMKIHAFENFDASNPVVPISIGLSVGFLGVAAAATIFLVCKWKRNKIKTKMHQEEEGGETELLLPEAKTPKDPVKGERGGGEVEVRIERERDQEQLFAGRHEKKEGEETKSISRDTEFESQAAGNQTAKRHEDNKNKKLGEELQKKENEQKHEGGEASELSSLQPVSREMSEQTEKTNLKIQNEKAGENEELRIEAEPQTDQKQQETPLESQEENTEQPKDLDKREAEHQGKLQEKDQDRGEGQDNAKPTDETEASFQTEIKGDEDQHIEKGRVKRLVSEIEDKQVEESHKAERKQQNEDSRKMGEKIRSIHMRAENNVNVEETEQQGDEREEKLQSKETENPRLHQETGLQAEQQQKENPPGSEEEVGKSNVDLNKREEKHQEKEGKDQERNDANETDNTEFMIQADGQKDQKQRGEENNTEKEKTEGEPQKTENEEKHVGEAAAGPTENKEPENQTEQLNVQPNKTKRQTDENERQPESEDQEETGSEGDKTDLKLQDKQVETERDENKELLSKAEKQRTAPKTEETLTSEEGASAGITATNMEAEKHKQQNNTNFGETEKQSEEEKRLQTGSSEIPEQTEKTNLKIQNEKAGENEELRIEAEPQTDQKQQETPLESQEENTEQPKDLDKREAEHQGKLQEKDQDRGEGQDNAKPTDETEASFQTEIEGDQDQRIERGHVKRLASEIEDKQVEELHKAERKQQNEDPRKMGEKIRPIHMRAENNVNVEETEQQGDEREEKLQSKETKNPRLHQETGLQAEQQQKENPPRSQEEVGKSNVDLNKREEKHQEKEEKDQGRDDAHETDNTEFMIQADGQKDQKQRGEESNTEKEKTEGEPQKTENEEKHVGEEAAGPTENQELENQTERLNVQPNKTEGLTDEKERPPESEDQEETGSEGDKTDLKLHDKEVETERDGNKELFEVQVVGRTAGTDQTERTDVDKAGQDNAHSLSDNTEDDSHTDVERDQDQHVEEGHVTRQE